MNKVAIILCLLICAPVGMAAKKNLELEALRIEFDNFITDKKIQALCQGPKEPSQNGH